MAKLSTIFQRASRLAVLRELNTVRDTPTHGIRDWLFSGTYSFQIAPTAKQFEIFVPSSATMFQSYAYDINRMSSGAFETVLSISPIETMRRSLAWLAIQLYYASFYSAHSFLRMQGVSCTQLDGREAGRLAAVSQAYGFSPGRHISNGFHVISFNETTKKLVFKASASGGGSHETLWAEYLNGLSVFESRVAASSFLGNEIAAVTSKLASIRRALCIGGSKNGNWLSRMRNEINYRHSQGVWWPHSASNNIDHAMNLLRSSLTCDPMDNDIEEKATFDAFMKACLFVINLTRIATIDMANLDPDGRSFQEAGPMVILRRGRLTR